MDPKILINLIKAAAFAALLTPFIKAMDFYFPYVGPKGIYFMVCAQIIFFLWAVLAWKWKQYRPDIKNPVIAAILLFLGVSFAAAVFGADFSASFWSKFERMGGVLMLFHLAAFALAVSSVFTRRDWGILFCASSGAAAIVGLNALFDQSAASRGGGFIGNDSFLGTYLLFNAFFALYLFLSREWRPSRWMRILSAVFFAVICFCLVFESTVFWNSAVKNTAYIYPDGLFLDIVGNGARAAKISLLAGVVLLGLLMAARKNKIVRAAAISFAGVAAAAVLFAAVSLFSGGEAYRFVVDKFGESTVNSRAVVWQIGWKGFLERPLLGWGPENFGLVFARHYNPCLGSPECGRDIWYDRAHNIVVDTLVETGAIGLLAYLAVFAAAIFVLWKSYFSRKEDFAAVAAFTALLAAYSLQNLTVFDMISSYVMLFMSLAFISSLWKPAAEEYLRPAPLEPYRAIVPLAAAIACFYFFAAGPLSAGRNTIVAINPNYAPSQKVENYRKGLEASPLGKYQIRIFFANQWLVDLQNKEFVSRMSREQINSIFAFHSEELEKSVKESPFDYQSYLQLGRIYNYWSVLDKSKLSAAENVLEKAIGVAPNNQQAYWDLAQTYFHQERIGDALAFARKAYELYPASVQAKAAVEEFEKLEKQLSGGKE